MSAIRKSSFATAAGLLPGHQATAIRALYAACREVDDLADETGGAAARAALSELNEDLATGTARSDTAETFVMLHRTRGLDLAPARALVTAVAGDLDHRPFEGWQELSDYAQGVAGTVGLMMCDLMGATGAEARARGAALGRAMQLTNIARDVFADARMGRRYLPASLCSAPPARLAAMSDEVPPSLRRAVHAVLAEAERQYDEGLRGLALLGPAPRLAVANAALSYRDIGRRIAADGYRPPRRRIRPRGGRQLALSARAALLAASASRLGRPHVA